MLSCLSLLHHTHVRVELADDPLRTACGISVVDTAEAAMFAAPARTATCTGCRRAIGAEPAPEAPKETVRRYLGERGQRVVVDDLIAEGSRVFARYHVAAAHANGLAAIFTVAGQRIVAVEPIVDDVDLLTTHLEGTA